MADPHSKGPSEKKNVWHSDRTHRQEQESRSILLNRLNSRIEELFVPLIVNKSQHICIIDPPWYPNVGDSAILLGELSFLKRKFPEAKLSFYDSRNYSSSADVFIEEATILLIHGGGGILATPGPSIKISECESSKGFLTNQLFKCRKAFTLETRPM